ncbi:MAG: thiamine pyrophosphate-binding protein [Pseudomonadota bacterium]|nr:thiamine pyrophosphate-binding protein [Pseudomonadota bacterium]
MTTSKKTNNGAELNLVTTNDINDHYAAAHEKEDVSDWFVKCLLNLGIDQVFGLPGAAIEPLYNGLGRAKREMPIGPSIITVKHEAAAAFAAEGYYKATGKIALCCATAGPGTTNLITGLASAKLERVPMLVVTGQTKLEDFSRGVIQDSSRDGISTVSLLNEVCNYSSMVTHPSQLIHKLHAALSIAMGPNPGPVHLSVPLDIFRMPLHNLSTPFPAFNIFKAGLAPVESIMPDQLFVEALSTFNRFTEAATVVIGTQCADAIDEIIELANTLNWNIIATPNAKGLIDHQLECFKGTVGLGGHALAYKTLDSTKGPILILGTPFDEVTTGGWDTSQLPPHRVIQIDPSPLNLQTFLPAKVRCTANVKNFVLRLKSALYEKYEIKSPQQLQLRESLRPSYIDQRHWDSFETQDIQSHCIKPQKFMWKLNELAGKDTAICTDTSGPYMWAMHMWQSKPHKRVSTPNNFYLSMALSTMGWALGASVGVAQGLKSHDDFNPVICITGDGSYLMSSQEIGTAVQQGLNIAFFVLNNASYGIVEHCQVIVGAEQIAFKLPDVNYADFGKGFGIPSFRIQSIEDLEKAWDVFVETPGPVLFDVIIDADEMPPFGHRLESLGFANKK